MVTLAGLAILHGCVAAAFVEALMRVWHVQAPGARLTLRATALLAPFVSVPFSWALAPWPHDPVALREWVLFAGPHWDNLRVGPVPGSIAATFVLAGLGLILFARDTLPYLADRIRRSHGDETCPPDDAGYVRLERLVADLPGDRPPSLTISVLRTSAPVLYCSGWAAPQLTASTGTLALLDDETLRAAVAHELAHLRYRDPGIGWLLILVRTLQAFNPATQIVGRQFVEDIEHRADWSVAQLGWGIPLARAVATLSGGLPPVHSDLAPPPSLWRPIWGAFADRAARHATDARCARILALHDVDAYAPPGPALRALAIAALATILCFVA